jgi:hypothetical protein
MGRRGRGVSARGRAAGLGESLLVWAGVAVVGAATVVTYARLPAGSTYHYDASGLAGGLGRLAGYLNFPVALAAVALAAVARAALPPSRRLDAAALAACLLCALAAAPGVVDQGDLRARWVNAAPVAGVLLAAALTLLALRRRGPARLPRLAGDPLRALLTAVLTLWSVPWLAAALGFYASDAPVLGAFVRARQPTPGEPALASVHLGLHEGLFGVQLAVAALLLSRALPALGRGRRPLSLYLALMLCYGVAVAAQDGWNEQVVKRGLTGVELPNVLQPSLSPGWLGVVVAALLVHLVWFAREGPAPSTARRSRPLAGGAGG